MSDITAICFYQPKYIFRFGTFIGIGLGCFFLFMLIVIFCTCYQRRAVASAQGRTTVYRGTAGGPTVVTTTALGPQYNMGE